MPLRYCYRKIGECYLLGKNLIKSQQYLNLSLKATGGSIYIHFNLGLFYHKVGDYQNAQDYLMYFYINKPYDSPICYHLALNFYHKKDFENSVTYCTKALLNDNYNHKAHFLMSELQIRKGQFQDALLCLHWAQRYQEFNRKKIGCGVHRNLRHQPDFKELGGEEEEGDFTADQLKLNKGVCYFYLYKLEHAKEQFLQVKNPLTRVKAMFNLLSLSFLSYQEEYTEYSHQQLNSDIEYLKGGELGKDVEQLQ